ncbi:hypothetical protein MG293_017068, partial [Ovis ammon polii]
DTSSPIFRSHEELVWWFFEERQPVAINDNASQQIREMAGSFGVLIFSSSGHTEQ